MLTKKQGSLSLWLVRLQRPKKVGDVGDISSTERQGGVSRETGRVVGRNRPELSTASKARS